ncbi:unnamed protein product, partial [Discosporangium mesarthrocarpum]
MSNYQSGHGKKAVNGKGKRSTTWPSSSALPPAPTAAPAGPIPSSPSDGGCEKCHKNDNQDKILLCDRCNGEYHYYCLDPPLSGVPADSWFCPKCTETYPPSRYRGVRQLGVYRWQAEIYSPELDDMSQIGVYKTEKEAAQAHDRTALRESRQGRILVLNFPRETYDSSPEMVSDEETEKEEDDDADAEIFSGPGEEGEGGEEEGEGDQTATEGEEGEEEQEEEQEQGQEQEKEEEEDGGGEAVQGRK